MTSLTLKLTNNATATFAADVAADATTFSLSAGQGARFPALAGDDYFPLTAVKPTGEREIMYAVARSFDVVTVLRHQENTVPLAFLAGEILECRLTAGALLDAMGKLTNLVNSAVTAFEPGAGVTTATVLSSLTGALTSDQFTAQLNTRIDQIDATAAVPGSVNARVKAETDSRVAAVQAEIDARIAAVDGEATARAAYVQNYTYAKSATDAAIAFQASTTQTNYTAYADAKKAEAISTAAADVRTYAYSKSSSDGALSTQLTNITASYTTYADTKSAEAQAAATAAAQAKADLALVNANAHADGIVTTEEARAIADATAKANAAQSAATAAAAIDATNKANAAISTASADVRSYSYSQAQTNSAISASETTLRSEISGAGYATQAYVQSYSYSVAQADAAIASQTSDLRTTVGNHTTAINTNATTVNGLSAQYTVKIDSNGYVTGYGLASSTAGSAPTSYFTVLAANFQVVAPGASPAVMFSVGGGTVGFSGELKGPSGTLGILTAATIQSAASGQRTVTTQTGTRVYDGAGTLRVELGELS